MTLRFAFRALLLVGFGLLTSVPGCSSPLFFRGQSPEAEEIVELADETKLIGDVAVSWGMNWIKLESVALMTALDGTGSDPPPGSLRSTLTAEMQTHEVRNHEKVLASSDTALVLVKGYVRPGIQEGDRFDIEVQVPARSKTTSLAGGFVMRSRLRQMAVLDNELHSGEVLGLARGRVVVDSLFQTSEDKVHDKRGRVLGGGVALKSRPLGLVVSRSNSSILTSKRIGAAINGRFHSYNQGSKQGVATPKRDNFIEIRVHPRYKHNVPRYMRVIRNLALRESAADQADRIEVLRRMLLEPVTASSAALQLEAIGDVAVDALRPGLASTDPEVRFYAAEALAYLDQAEAAPVLAAAARDEPAFRWHAFTALSTMDHVAAYDGLVELLGSPSAETRYGAFRALQARNPRDPIVRGTTLGENVFQYHLISQAGEPMVHFSRTRRPEVILFGHEQTMLPPAFLFAGKEILIKGIGSDQIKVSRFVAGSDDQHKICSRKLDEVIRAIVDLGGGYQEVMQAVHTSKLKGYTDARVAFEALPQKGRRYRRDEIREEPSFRVATPLPYMFDVRSESSESNESLEYEQTELESPSNKGGIFARMKGWWASEPAESE